MAMSRLPAALLAAFAVVLAWQLFATNPAHQTALARQKAEPGAIEVKEIALSKIYSTSFQAKLKDVREPLADDAPGMKALRAQEDTLMAAKSPPLIGIVRGENIKDAVIASGRLVQMKKAPKDTVGPDPTSTSKMHWLFVYLGATSSTPVWSVYPVQVAENRFRLSYSLFDYWPYAEEGNVLNADFHPYLYWVPLGEPKDPSSLQAELVELTRMVKASYPARQKK
jgi:hypothetical protein